MNIRTPIFAALLSVLISTYAQAQSVERGPSIQALLGAVRYDDIVVDNGYGGYSGTVDVSTMPQFGGVWSTAPKGDKLQIGLECNFLMGFNYGSAAYTTTTPASRISVDYNVWMFELAGGVYGHLFFGKNDMVRLYAATGPLIMSSILHAYTYKDGLVDDSYYYNSEYSFGWGFYARTGIELRVKEYGMLGLGVRGSWADTDIGAGSDLTGIAAFVSFTSGL